MLSLVWRGTFIDVDGDIAPATPRRPRATSEPRRSAVASEHFDGERTYVAALSEKFAPAPASEVFMENVPRSLAPVSGSMASDRAYVAVLSEELAPAPALEVLEKGADAADLEEEATSGGGGAAFHELKAETSNQKVSSFLFLAKVGRKGAAADMADANTREPSSTASFLEATPMAATPSDLTSTIASNIGSIGHPDLCSRPCLYIGGPGCSHAEACEFCHMGHARRMPRLNKLHRERLRCMDAKKATSMVLLFVREKALAFNGSAETTRAVDDLARACGVLDGPRLQRSHDEQKLFNVFSGMTVRLLLIILQRSVLSEQPEALQAADALLKHLRGVAAGAENCEDDV